MAFKRYKSAKGCKDSHGGETYFRTILKERLKWIHKIIGKRSILKANAIISVSDYTLNQTLKIFNMKKKSYLTKTIYNPINIYIC